MWVFNVFLYMMFVFSPQQYKQAVAAGEPCYGYAAQLGDDPSPQPVCFYDPSNTNPGR